MPKGRKVAVAVAMAVVAVMTTACGGGDGATELNAETQRKVDQQLEESLALLDGQVERSQLECVRDSFIRELGAEEVERALADPEGYEPPPEFDEQKVLDGCGVGPFNIPQEFLDDPQGYIDRETTDGTGETP
jgi:hypothetical protein